MRAQRHKGLWLSALLLGAILLVAPDQSTAQASRTVVRHVVNRQRQQSLNYWTPARMRHARLLSSRRQTGLPELRTGAGVAGKGKASFIPASSPGQQFEGGSFGQASGDGASTSALGIDTGDSSVFPNRVNGQIFGQSGGYDFACSGSVVTSPSADVVLTAGHCVYDPDTANFTTNVVFAPGYRDGVAPFGTWPVEQLTTSAAWTTSVDQGFPDEASDIGVLELAPSNGREIADELGALGVAFNQPVQQTYTEYGYPAEPAPYDGQRLLTVTSPLTGEDFSVSPPALQIASDFRSGASGGPFVVGAGQMVESVGAYSYVGDSNYFYGPYFSDAAESVYCTAGGLLLKQVSLYKGQGIAYLKISLPCDGKLTITGPQIQTRHRQLSHFGGDVWIPVLPRWFTANRLSRRHHLKVLAYLTYKPRIGSVTKNYTTVRLVWRHH